MLVLVTQSDGSARRFSWISYALAALLVCGFASFQENPEQAEERELLALQVRQHFDEHPFVEVSPVLEEIIPASYALEFNETYFEERRSSGLPLLSPLLSLAVQEEFDELVTLWLHTVARRPAWRHGAGGDAASSWLAHVGVHETRYALIISLIFLLLIAIPLEDGWGPLIFGPFCLLAVVFTAGVASAVGYAGAVGSPFVGAGGLISALAGAYLLRSLVGSPLLLGTFRLPVWGVIPLWLAFEYVGIRQVLETDGFSSAPVLVHAAGLGFGLATGAGMAALRIEAKQIERQNAAKEVVSNPILERAMKAREEGREEFAFDLLKRELGRAGGQHDLSQAYWDLAVVLGREEEAIPAGLIVIEGQLRAGNGSQAVALWFALHDAQPEIESQPRLRVRIAEAMIAEGHAAAAIDLLRSVLDEPDGIATVMAQRIVAIARDLDPELTGCAARMALADGRLGAADREHLVQLSEEIRMSLPESSGAEVDSSSLEQASEIREPEPQPEPQQEFAGISLTEENALLDLDESFTNRNSWEDAEMDLDPDALSLSDVDDAPASELEDVAEPNALADPGAAEELEDSQGILNLSTDLADDLDEIDLDELDLAGVEAGLLDNLPQLEAERGEGATGSASAEHRGEETVTEVAVPSLENDRTTVVDLHRCDPEFSSEISAASPLRPIRVREAVPVNLEANALIVEIDGGGKTRLDFARIEALAAAAVHGIALKPVVIIDLVLNWQTASEPLKLIRLRSDRFDPRKLVAGLPSPLDSLRQLLSQTLQQSNVQPLPDRERASGTPFQAYSDLASYQREVLGGES